MRLRASICAVLASLIALSAMAQQEQEQEQEQEREQAPAADAPTGPSAAEIAALAPAVETSPPGASAGPLAIDRIDLGATSITGNQELPKVLYIVPWKQSDLGELIGRPVNTLLDEVLAPVDPEVFERHLSYYETLHGASQEE